MSSSSYKQARAVSRPTARRGWRIGRVVALGAALVLAALALGEIAGWPFLRGPLARQLAGVTGSGVSLDGPFRAQLLLHPGIEVGRMSIGASAAVAVPHLLQAEGVVLRWRWGDLWRARQGAALRLKALEADQIDAHLVRLASGATSWPPASSPRAEDGERAATLPQIERLVLKAGTVVYRDEALRIDLSTRIAQSSGPHTALPWRAEASGRYQGAPVDLLAQAGATLPLLLQSEAGAALTPLRLSGRIGSTELDFDGATGALWAGQGMRGDITLRGASLRRSAMALGITLPDTPPYRLRGRLARHGAVWSLVTPDTTVGSSALSAALQFDRGTEPPTLSGHVGGRRLAFVDLAPAVGADQPPRNSARVLPDERFELPSLAQMNANVRVDLAQLDFGSPSLAPVTDLRLHLTLVNSALQLNDLSARVAGGVLSGSMRLQADQAPPRWQAALRFAEVDLARWIRAVAQPAAPAQEHAPAYLGGTLNARLSLRGTGNSVAEVLGGADGQLHLALLDGHMSQLVTEALGLDAAQALGLLIAGDQALRLNCARAEAVIRNGVLKTRHAVLDNDDSTLFVQGGASLRDESLRLRVVAQPKDFSPLSLRTPLNVSGSFQRPRVQIEASGLLARAAGALLLGALAPPAALLAFMDLGAEPDTAPCAPPPTPRSKKP